MSDFAFVPRSVSKRNAPTPTTRSSIVKDTSEPHISPFNQLPSSSGGSNVKSRFTTDDILTLLRLCLSRYNCWLDRELLRTIQKSGEGYVPIQHLLEHVPPLCELESGPSELEIVHALRSVDDTQHNFDVRMIIQEPSRNEWHFPTSSGANARAAGLFEIRRRDYEEAIRSINAGIGKGYWDSRFVYVERLPPTYRTKHAITQFISHLVVSAKGNLGECSKCDYPVENVSFPPHHSDPERKVPPRYKGFTFVILDSLNSAEALCDAYSWNSTDSTERVQSEGRRMKQDQNHKLSPSDMEAEAIKFGTRALSKTSWDKFKEEYLNYQKSMLASSANMEEEDECGIIGAQKPNALPGQDVSSMAQDQTDKSRNLLNSPRKVTIHNTHDKTYPENCLVFVKNVHPETNKTTLRQLFASSLSSATAIDYVDFGKGIDWCHLRLTNSFEAARLVSYFTTSGKLDTAQLAALDNQGGPSTADRPALVVELVQGKREEFYWEKVPQKLREKALIVAVRLGNQGDPSQDHNDEVTHRAKRKKRHR